MSSSFLNNWCDRRYAHIFKNIFPKKRYLIIKFVTISTNSWVSGMTIFWRLGIIIFEIPYCPNYIARNKRAVLNSSYSMILQSEEDKLWAKLRLCPMEAMHSIQYLRIFTVLTWLVDLYIVQIKRLFNSQQ